MNAWSELGSGDTVDREYKKQEKMIVRCLEMNRQCVLVCRAATTLLSVKHEYASILCFACAEICDACADECEKYKTDSSQRCSKECRSRGDECRKMANMLNSQLQKLA